MFIYLHTYLMTTTTHLSYGLCSPCGVGMPYADDACIVSLSPQELAKIMEVIVEVCRAFALPVSAKKTNTTYMPPPCEPWTIVRVEAAGQIYRQVQSFTYLGGAVAETPEHVRCNRQANPRMLDAHRAVPA